MWLVCMISTCSQNIDTKRHSLCTSSILAVQDCPLVPCACADGSGMNFELVPIIAQATPLTVSSCSGSNYMYVRNGDILTLLECCYWTTDRYDKEQTSPLASLEARWLVPAPA